MRATSRYLMRKGRTEDGTHDIERCHAVGEHCLHFRIHIHPAQAREGDRGRVRCAPCSRKSEGRANHLQRTTSSTWVSDPKGRLMRWDGTTEVEREPQKGQMDRRCRHQGV